MAHIDIDIHNNPDLLEMLVLEITSPRFNWCLCANVSLTNSQWNNLPEKTPRFFRLNLDHRFIQWQCHDTVGHFLYGDATSIKCTRDLADLLNFIEKMVELLPTCSDGYSVPLSLDPVDPTSAQQAKEAFDKAYIASLFEKAKGTTWYYDASKLPPFTKVIADLADKLAALKAQASKNVVPIITTTQTKKKPLVWADDHFPDFEMKEQINKEMGAIVQKCMDSHLAEVLKKYLQADDHKPL